MTAPTSDELQLIQIFRRRLTPLNFNFEEGQSSDQHLLRWIRARESDLTKAEEMLKKHMDWRKSHGIGPSLLDWSPNSFLTTTYNVKFVTFDPTGCPVLLFTFGQWDIRKALERGDKEALVRYKDQILEQIMKLMRLYENYARKNPSLLTASGMSTNANTVTQFIGICDWTDFSLKYIMNKEAVEVILDSARSFEANYPETLKAGFNVNCPKVFAILFNLVKPFLSERTLSKIFIYDSNVTRWKQEILKQVPSTHLPYKYGGLLDRVWELSKLNISQGEEDPTLGEIIKSSISKNKYEASGFGNMSFTTVRVAPGYKVSVPLTCEKVGSRISWHFRVEEKDIGYSVAYEGGSNSALKDEVVKYERVDEDLGSVICEQVGTYILYFDNTYSNFKGKVVQYKVTLDNPFSLE